MAEDRFARDKTLMHVRPFQPVRGGGTSIRFDIRPGIAIGHLDRLHVWQSVG